MSSWKYRLASDVSPGSVKPGTVWRWRLTAWPIPV
jgi:hypothetical protein